MSQKSNKKLLSVTNLKKYFPVAKSSIFQKEQLYVRANEDITFDIYEGETIGIAVNLLRFRPAVYGFFVSELGGERIFRIPFGVFDIALRNI